MAPFLIVVNDPSGNYTPMVSIATTSPSANSPVVTNVSPLTTIVASQAGITATTAASTALSSASLATFNTIKTSVLNQLSAVATNLGISNYDPFTTPITAASATQAGNAADQMLDTVAVTIDQSNGNAAFALIDGSKPVDIATPGSSTPPTPLAPPTVITGTEISKLSALNSSIASTFNTCFSGTTSAQRVPSANTLGSMCNFSALTSSTGSTSVPAYLHNGYNFFGWFGSLLTSSSMDVNNGVSAKFTSASVMAIYPDSATGGNDKAVLNLIYTDASGNPGNIITMAQYIGGAWYVTGNQDTVDISVKTRLRMVTEMNSSTTISSFSHFQSGLIFNINAKGPGSTDSNGNALSYAIVTGPGLPSSGLTYIAPVSAEGSQVYMDLSNANGTLGTGLQCGNTITQTKNLTFNCPNYWFGRTAGITGANATTFATSSTSITWDQSGQQLADSLLVAKGAKYSVALYYGNSTTPGKTIVKRLLTDLTPATNGINLQWNTLGVNSTAAFNPTGNLTATQATLTMDWVQNPLAQQIRSVYASIAADGTYGQSQAVQRGALSVVYNPALVDGIPTDTISALSTTTGSLSRRYLEYGYRVLDNSDKDAVYQYDYN